MNQPLKVAVIVSVVPEDIEPDVQAWLDKSQEQIGTITQVTQLVLNDGRIATTLLYVSAVTSELEVGRSPWVDFVG